MKKIIFLVISVVVVVALAIIVVSAQRTNDVRIFSINDYSYYVDKFSSNLYVEEIRTPQEARSVAESIWTEVYGNSIKFKKPYTVSYDGEHDVWLVEGNLIFGDLGGVPYILVNGNGEVLAVWHDK